MRNSSRPIIILGIGLLTIGLGAAWLLAPSDNPPPTAGAEPLVEPNPTTPLEPARSPSEPAPKAAEPPADPTRPAAPDREATDRMRADIQRALARRTPTTASRPSAPAAARSDGPVDVSELSEHNREYLRERVRDDLLPPLLDCYNSALTVDPELAGTLVLQFAVIGDPEIGGVVEYAEIIAGESTLISEFMSECLRESAMAMTFDAPPEGGRFELHYPIEFEPDDGT